jgi:hypothetical protein
MMTGHADTKAWLAEYLPPDPLPPPPAVNDGPTEAEYLEADQRRFEAIHAANELNQHLPPEAFTALCRQAGVEQPETLLTQLETAPIRPWAAKPTVEDKIATARDRYERLAESIGKQPLAYLTATDDELLIYAKEYANDKLTINARAEALNLEPLWHPSFCDPHAVRRRMRRAIGRAGIHLATALGLVGGPRADQRPAYVDGWTFNRWRAAQASAKSFLDSHDLYDAARDVRVSLAEVAKSAATAREAQWYAMLLGIAQVADRRGWIPQFITLTLPTEYHLNPTHGGRGGDEAISPTAAVKELNDRWHRVLAMLHQRDVTPVGCRVIEPHADACPHLHCCIWLPPDAVADLQAALNRHFPATTPTEAQARTEGDYSQGPAVKVVTWNPNRGASPVTYVLTYVLKTLRADRAVTDNEDGADADRGGHDRAAAWASVVGARRLSLVGLRPGTMSIWKAVQRTSRHAESIEGRIDEPRARAIAHAMKKRRWGAALLLMGAFSDTARLQPIRAEREDCWGDRITFTTGYAHPRTNHIGLTLRPHIWTIVAKKKEVGDLLSVVDSYPRAGAGAPPDGSAGPPPTRRKPSMMVYLACNDDEMPDFELAV